LDTPPLKLLDAVKHAVEDKRFFLSEQLLNVGEGTLIFKIDRALGSFVALLAQWFNAG